MDENTLAINALILCLNQGISFFVGALMSAGFCLAATMRF